MRSPTLSYTLFLPHPLPRGKQRKRNNIDFVKEKLLHTNTSHCHLSLDIFFEEMNVSVQRRHATRKQKSFEKLQPLRVALLKVG